MLRSSIFALILLLSLCMSPQVQACPSCKNAVATDASGNVNESGAGFSYSIYLMMAVPYLIMASFGGALYLSYRKSLAADASLHEEALAEKGSEAQPVQA